ncbi:MAG TPA: NmrA family NAD(P)-binding protein [Planctomycetota bacterium]|nr:NmrA family NAD(P)-binding protein [Planctomycetota bacterium]
MSKRVIAVVGATGHIGTVLTEALLKKGHEVRALGRDQTKLAALASKGAKTRTAAFDDAAALTDAFKGADAAFTMIPPSYGEESFSAWQDRSGEAIAKAVSQAKVKHVVDLSSVGAQHASGTGPITGLHRQEKRLEALSGLNVLHLRASYFMENHFWSIPTIKSAGINGSPVKADLVFSQVATADIGQKAAERLDRLDFNGRVVVEFGGPRELTLKDTTAILGRAIGKPDLQYVQFPYEDAEKAMAGSGMKPGTAKLMVEMYRGFNEGLCRPETPIKDRGAVTIEDFAAGFARAFKAG